MNAHVHPLFASILDAAASSPARIRRLATFDSTIAGIPCQIAVTHWDKYHPAKTYGPPENCHPEEGGTGDWEVLDRRGRPAPWLERKLTDNDRERIDREVFSVMEQGDEL